MVQAGEEAALVTTRYNMYTECRKSGVLFITTHLQHWVISLNEIYSSSLCEPFVDRIYRHFFAFGDCVQHFWPFWGEASQNIIYCTDPHIGSCETVSNENYRLSLLASNYRYNLYGSSYYWLKISTYGTGSHHECWKYYIHTEGSQLYVRYSLLIFWGKLDGRTPRIMICCKCSTAASWHK